jgi:uncharacterized membrane protein YidH (DUF202 family)
MGLRKHLGGDLPPEAQGRRFARIVRVVLWVFTAGFALGALQVGRALWSRKVWVDYRGQIVSAAEMWRELAVFALLAIVCALMAWYWHRYWRRRS